jgi:para-nitrobenzyl esterase
MASMSMVKPALAVAIMTSISGVAAAQPARCTVSEADAVCTEQGAVRGSPEGETLAFKGIPYAKPPIGPLRWKPPEPPAHWDGIRDGSSFGPMCPQLAGKEVQGEEDCLFLNIWRLREKPGRPLPVMVWLTGGGNHAYSGRGSPSFGGVAYNGEQLVPQGVIFVSYNSRLGALGFLAHPALDAERPEKISGNYGSLDQIAMLQWLRRNIGTFAGDPSRIFLFGTSAGGGNICALITSPSTRGLVHDVAMQSSVPVGCEMQTLADAENGTGRRVVKALGCDSAPDIAACLRSKNIAEIVSAVPGNFSVLPRVYGPNVDGHVFPDQPIKLITDRQYPPMAVIIGNTTGETKSWADSAGPVTDQSSYAAVIEKLFGAVARDRILAVYPANAYPTPRDAFARLTTDAEFTCQSRRVARALFHAQKEPVYRYLDNHVLENDPELEALGPTHTVEHPFFFAWQGKYRPSETDRRIQRYLVGYWTRMAKTGDPNGGGDPEWPAYSSENDAYLEIGATTAAKVGPAEAHCDFWDTVPLLWPHV